MQTIALVSLAFLTGFQAFRIGRILHQVSIGESKDCSECGDGCKKICYPDGSVGLQQSLQYMVSVRNSSGEHKCGGTLIASNVVLTAAHCIRQGERPTVHIGRFSRILCDCYGFDSLHTIRAIVHPEYDRAIRYDLDVALLVLDAHSNRETVTLATSDSCFEHMGGCRVKVLGWGAEGFEGGLSNRLREVSTHAVNRGVCKHYHGESRISNSMICAGEHTGGADSCHGDSGGPLIQDNKQVGIVSWGEGCPAPVTPGVYTSVPKVLPWIQEHMDQTPSVRIASGPNIVNTKCDCADDGVSGGVYTGRFGCKKHLIHVEDSGTFCMVNGGANCATATPSKSFPGAAWKACNPQIDSRIDG